MALGEIRVVVVSVVVGQFWQNVRGNLFHLDPPPQAANS
jgi:hypothetical protein